jgi:hypothetical protein
MAIPSSTVVAVKNYLFTQMSAQIVSDGLQVYYDEPGPGFPDDVIWLGATRQVYVPTEMVGGGGAGFLFENYHQIIEVSVYRGGDTPQLVFERAAALVAQIESIVRTDLSLGSLPGVIVAYPAGTDYESGWEDSHMGRVTDAQIRIQVEARPSV